MNKRKNYKRGNKGAVFIALIAMIFQLLPISPIMKVRATDITSSFPFITEVTLTDGNNKLINESSNPISKNSEVKLTYKFTIPNKGSVKKGDSYAMQIPKEIEIISVLNFPITLDNGDTIANVKIETDGKVDITFTEFAENNSNVSGFFYIDTQFNPDKIGGSSPVPIKFEVGGGSDPIEINVNFEQPEVPNASVEKYGDYDASKNEITWEVLVNRESVTVNNAQIVDKISEGQEFIPGSVEVNGTSADTGNYKYDSASRSLTYNFPKVIDSYQTIKFKTKVTNPKAFESEGNTVYEYNTATFNHDGTSVESNKASVEIYTDFIRKDGSYDSATRRINWTIHVNNNAQNIPNAVVTDDIPEGLTFVEGSVKVDEEETKDNYTINGQKFTYSFPNAINEPHKIEFSTEVTDEGAFNSNTEKTYNNKVTLIGNGVPANASDNKGVGVPTSIISKQGIGYNKATGEITWRVTVNSNKISIKNAVVTDDIRLGQEYIQGSATIDKNTPGGNFNYVPSVSDSAKTGTLTYTFNGDINETYTITFKTKITDPKVYAGNMEGYSYNNQNYYNEAKLTGENIKDSIANNWQYIKSEVINKSSQDYNHVTREITWKVVVNKNKMPLPNAYFTDIIKEGQEFVSDSVMLNGSLAETSNYNYDEKTRTLRYNFPKEIKEEQVITFKTKITDTSIFNSNGSKKIENTAKLITDLVPGGIESTGTREITSSLLDKKANYTRGNSYIDWNVTINSSKILIKDAVLTDILQEGLELDTSSVKLFKQILQTNGTLVKGDEVTLDKNSVKYNSETREFTFTLPSQIEDAYILTFRTDVVDKTKSPFTNSVSFKGTGMTESSGSSKVDVIFQGAGGGGVGETGSIKVIKVDQNNENAKLEGAVFELLDKYQNVIKTSEPTSENGEVIFDRLKFDIDYHVREKVAPTGYVLSNELYKFQLKNTQDKKNITYNYKNEKIKGEIEFNKVDNNNNPLKGAEFTLYKLSDTTYKNPLGTALSDENGKVQFKNVEYGEYAIKETKAPEGYESSEEILKAAITEGGKVVKANPESISNTKIRGNIEFTKLGEDKKVLPGAEFKLYKEADTNFENPIATAISDESGKVEFKGVEYGKYVIKETKAPEGYVLSKEVLKATIAENGSVVKANPESISNTKIRGNIEFTKIEEDKTSILNFINQKFRFKLTKLGEDKKTLHGAEFKLYKEADTNFENPIATAISDENGNVEFKNVEYGKYVIKETKAPEGYLLSDEKLSANITEDGVTIKANPESISNTKIRGNIEFTKLGEDQKPLQGAEFKLYKEADTNFENLIATSTSDENGHVEFKNVEYGKYVIKETKAPEGYVLSSEVLKATISENGSVVKANPESISNTKIRGNIELTKFGEDKKPLQGAEFKLYKEADTNFENPIATAISDESGKVEFKNIEYGKYTIKETKAPEGYVLSNEVLKATISENGSVVKANPESISNTKIRGNIELTKFGEDKNPLQGAEFKLYKEEDANFENTIATAISDENGHVEFKNVEYGKYVIKETKAPEGYVLSSEVLKATISENGSVVKANPESISNTKIRGNIELTKFGEDKNPLQGAEFKLYKEADTNFENPIATAISDESGKVQFKNVEYGKYVIKESKAPEGYVLSSEVLKATIAENGSVVKANPESISNTKIRGNIELTKFGEDKNPLQGAEFKLYKEEDTNFENLIATSASDESGKVQFKNVEYGKYVIKETKAPEGYVLSSEVLKATIAENGSVVKANPESISNTKIRGNIELTKFGEDKNPLQGAEFKLYKEEDTNFENPIATSTSDENGHVEFKNVEYGKYIIKESKAPEGYVLSSEVLKATISENGSVVKANPESISNTKIRGNIELTKFGEDKNPLQGAEFKLYKEEDANFENTIATAISDENGHVEFKNVEYGKYIIKETKAPEGYLVSEGVIKVFVDKHGELYTYEVVNNRIKGVIIITKTDMKGKLLQGAEFTLYDTDGKEVTTVVSDKDGVAIFNNVDYGNYTVKETKAPKGYVLGKEKLEVSVNSPETQNFTIKNEAEKIKDKPKDKPQNKPNDKFTDTNKGEINNTLPKTGVLFDFKFMILIGALTILGGIGLLLKKK